jgi:DNA-binding transcriptional regulator YdaS (Cro superfamily)
MEKRQEKALLTHDKALLTWHRLYAGVYARVARDLGVDPSYVSRVARGRRQSESIERALISELNRIDKLRPKKLQTQ